MLLQLITYASDLLNSHYAIHATILIVVVMAIRVWVNGKSTGRDRDMHGRVVLLTGAFTPLGLVIMQQLAQRGAQIIALTPSLASPVVQELVSALRQATENELIFAEECDLNSPTSIRSFCKQLIVPRPSLDGSSPAEPQRIDAVIFTHEYESIGTSQKNYLASSDGEGPAGVDLTRMVPSLATFLLTTLVLPSLLRAPIDRDIRIINTINPLYAAAIPTFAVSPPSTEVVSESDADSSSTLSFSAPHKSSVFLLEGYRSLRAYLLVKHLQRIFDALKKSQMSDQSKMSTNLDDGPLTSSPAIDPNDPITTLSKAEIYKGSNMISVAVTPGFTAGLSISPLFAERTPFFHIPAKFIYILLYPLIYLFSKSTRSAVQSVLHVLFLPHPLKASLVGRFMPSLKPTKSTITASSSSSSTLDFSYVEPGALYRDCAPVVLPPRGEWLLGEEGIGRGVWEEMEKMLGIWEEKEKDELKAFAEELEKTKGKGLAESEKAKEG